MTICLQDLVREGLDRPVPKEAREFANQLASEGGSSVLAVLFYGSCLRNENTEGVLDFYILVENYNDYYKNWVSASANKLLPPTVIYRHGSNTRAKIAIVSANVFAKRMCPDSHDTSMWARFCQPSALLYCRDKPANLIVVNNIADAVATGAVWADRLAPKNYNKVDFWIALFKNTYGAELRVEEGHNRGQTIYKQAQNYFDMMLTPALAYAANKQGENGWPDGLTHKSNPYYLRKWYWKSLCGKMLNVIRLFKAAFTFDQRIEYIQWKVERHTGEPLKLTEFQKRHPIISAPGVLWRLWIKGLIR